MKKKLKGLWLILVTLCLTGCVKYEATMDISKDGKIDFSVLYAMDKSLVGDEGFITDEMKDAASNEGFSIEEYEDENQIGAKFKRSMNIKDVSTEDDTNYSISSMISEEDESSNYLFKVEKGILTNKYTAKFTFNTDSATNDNDVYDDSIEEVAMLNNEVTVEDGLQYDIEDDLQYDFEGEFENSIDLFGEEYQNELENMTSEMSLIFKVNLPHAAISNNATTLSNESKTLEWDLTNTNDIEFSFELINMTTVYIIAGSIFALIIVVTVLIIIVKKNKK